MKFPRGWSAQEWKYTAISTSLGLLNGAVATRVDNSAVEDVYYRNDVIDYV